MIFKTKRKNNEWRRKRIIFLKLANTTDESLKLKNILHFGNVFISQSFTGQEYCKINLFLLYIMQEEELNSFLEYIEKNLDFYFSKSLSCKTILIVINNFYKIGISEKRKDKISNLLKIMINYFENNADIGGDEPYFTPREIKDIKNEKSYYLTDKIIFFILEFHYLEIKDIKIWNNDKKRNIKLLLFHDSNKNSYLSLLKRYAICKEVKEKIDWINDYI